MSQDLRKMEWLYHVDLDPLKHRDGAEIAATAKIAYENVKEIQGFQPGDMLVIAVVRPKKH